MLFCPVCERRPDGGTICPDCGATLVVHQAGDDVSGQILANRYVVGERIGEGGMATVYRARRLPQNRAVAIKILRAGAVATDPKIAQRFLREGQLLQRLIHPNIVELIDFGQTPAGLPYLVLELLEGRPLGQSVPETGLPVEVACRMFEQICAGVAAAHDSGIVHRDLKPNNAIVLGRVGLAARVKVLDFGLARALDFGFESLTQAGLVIGTPGYLAPEQIDGTSPADERSDIYALGALLFYMLTGKPAYGGGPARTVLSLQLVDGPDLSALGERELPRAFETLIQTAMALDPLERFQTVGELLGRLNAVRMGDDESGEETDLPAELPELALDVGCADIVDESFADLVLDVPDTAVGRGRPDTEQRPPVASPATAAKPVPTTSPGVPVVKAAPPKASPPPVATAATVSSPKPAPAPTARPVTAAPPPGPIVAPASPTRAPSAPWTPPADVARLVRDRAPRAVAPVAAPAIHRESGAFRDIDARLSRIVLGAILGVAFVVAVALAVLGRSGADLLSGADRDADVADAGSDDRREAGTGSEAASVPITPPSGSDRPAAGSGSDSAPVAGSDAGGGALPVASETPAEPVPPAATNAPPPVDPVPPVAAAVDRPPGSDPAAAPSAPVGPVPTGSRPPASAEPPSAPASGSDRPVREARPAPERRVEPPVERVDPIPDPPARPVPEPPIRPGTHRTAAPPSEAPPSESADIVAWREAERRVEDLMALDARRRGEAASEDERTRLRDAAELARAGRWDEARTVALELERELGTRLEESAAEHARVGASVRKALEVALGLDARIATLRHEVGRRPHEPAGGLAHVRELLAAEDYDTAHRELASLVPVLKGHLATACAERGAELHARGQYGAAIAVYDEAISYAPERASAYYNRGIARFAQVRERHPGAVGEAATLVGTLADLDRALALDPSYAEARYARALARAHGLDLVGAARDLEAVCRATPERWEAWYQLGRVHGLGGLQRKALEALAEASRRAPAQHRDAVETLAIRIRRGE